MKSKNLLIAGALALSTVMTPVASMLSAMPIVAVENETDERTVTITDALPDVTYVAYQLFTGTPTENGSTLSDVQWGDGVTIAGQNAIYDYLKITNDSDKTAAKVAEILASYGDESSDIRAFAANLIDNKDSYLKEPSEGTTTTDEESGTTTATIRVPKDGYYLIVGQPDEGTERPTDVMVYVAKNINISSKNRATVEHEKKVKENETNTVTGVPNLVQTSGTPNKMNDVADYDIGDDIDFELAAKVPTDINKYDNYSFTFVDKMDSTLDLKVASIKVYAGSQEITSSCTITTTGLSQGETFRVLVPIKSKGQSAIYPAGTIIRVTFQASLNDNAKIGMEGEEDSLLGNRNKSQLIFTNDYFSDSTGTTEEDEVVIFTYKLPVKKTNEDGDPLSGAEFRLFKKVDNKNYYAVVKGDNGNYTFVRWVEQTENGEYDLKTDELMDLQADKDCNYVVKGIDEGTYYLEETKAPEGYNKLTEPVIVYLEATTKNDQNHAVDTNDAITSVQIKDKDSNLVEDGVLVVENKPGKALPETGGMGTTMLYAVGAILTGGAAVFYVTNRRMKKED